MAIPAVKYGSAISLKHSQPSIHPTIDRYLKVNATDFSSSGLLQEDLLIHGDSVYDIIDKQDHNSIQSELSRSVPQGQLLHHNHNHHHHNHNHHHHHHGSSPGHNSPPTTILEGEQRMFLCRMNVSRNARRQMRFGDQKVRYYS